MMHSGPHKLMLFGAACTHVTDPIAKASKHWHLTQVSAMHLYSDCTLIYFILPTSTKIYPSRCCCYLQLSYADTHPMFTRENFPNFFRIVPSENAFNPPRLSLLREFNWTRVGTIYQNEPRYSLAHNRYKNASLLRARVFYIYFLRLYYRLVAELDGLGYEVVETQSFTNEVNTALLKLKEKDTRVILGNFNEHWARLIFCEAYKLEMYGRKYQWIIMGTYGHEWWKRTVPDSNCTVENLEDALQQTILTDLLPLSTSGEITISGIVSIENNHVE